MQIDLLPGQRRLQNRESSALASLHASQALCAVGVWAHHPILTITNGHISESSCDAFVGPGRGISGRR